MATEYGSRLKLARKNARLTQAELSKKTGIPQSTISTAEREGYGSGETPVYAQACGVNALWLAKGHGEMLNFEPNKHLAGESIGSYAININTNRQGPPNALDVLNNLRELLVNVEPARLGAVTSLLNEWARNPGDDGMRDALAMLMAPQAFTPEKQNYG